MLSTLRRLASSGSIDDGSARTALAAWSGTGVVRPPMRPLLGRGWQLRTTVSAYDAAYVALAESLGCALVTADARLARAPRPHPA